METDFFWAMICRALAHGGRALLIVATSLVVIWAFGVVTIRGARNAINNISKPTLTLLHWGSPQEDVIVQQLCDRYMATHPDVHLEQIDSSEFTSKLKTMMAAGTPPDLFYLPPNLLPELATLKLIRPIDSYVKKDIEAGQAGYLKDFFPVLMDAFRYDVATDQSGSGQLYGLPKDFTPTLFYVNLDLFHAAAIRVPYDGWTWDEFETDMRKITDLGDRPEYAGRKIYGGEIELGVSNVQTIVRSFGGDLFGKDFRDVTLDSPQSQQALQMIARLRLKEKTLFNATGVAKDAGEEFLIGNIGCAGPLGRWKVPEFSEITNFKWDVVPIPYKTKADQTSLIDTNGWGMSSATRYPDRCFDLMKFLCASDGAVLQSRLGMAVPPLQSVANSRDFFSPPGIAQFHSHIFLDLVPFARLSRIPREAEWERIFDQLISRSLQMGDVSTLVNAHEIRDAWLKELDSPLRRHQWPPMRWSLVLWTTLPILGAIICIVWLKSQREKLGPLDRRQERSGWMFVSPWVIGFVALTLGPMIVSLLLSFTSWTGMTEMSSAKSVGVANYAELFTNDTTFFQSLKVTVYFVILAVPIGQAAALGVALLMNNAVRGIILFRTIFFVPSVVSGVALSVLWLQIYNNDYGLMNHFLRPITHLFGREPPDWFGRDADIFAIPAFVIMGLWGVGGGMILYLAGLKGIPTSLYEASRIDGAGAVRRFWNITLPMLSPLLFYNLVMGIIGSFQVFTQAYVIRGPGNSTLFYVLNLYLNAFDFHKMGYASAMAWVLFVIVLLLTIAVFRGSRKLVYYEGLK